MWTQEQSSQRWENQNWRPTIKLMLLQKKKEQESRAVARKPRDAAAVLFCLKFADNIHYKFKSIAKLRVVRTLFMNKLCSYSLNTRHPS